MGRRSGSSTKTLYFFPLPSEGGVERPGELGSSVSTVTGYCSIGLMSARLRGGRSDSSLGFGLKLCIRKSNNNHKAKRGNKKFLLFSRGHLELRRHRPLKAPFGDKTDTSLAMDRALFALDQFDDIDVNHL